MKVCASRAVFVILGGNFVSAVVADDQLFPGL